MKNIVLTIVVLTAATVFSQEKRTYAVLPECENAEKPESCLRDKVKKDIVSFFSEPIKDTLINKIDNTFFGFTVAFISNKDGSIDPESISATSKSEALNKKIKAYILKLPKFSPGVTKKRKPLRTVHMVYLIYRIDSEKNEISIPEPLEIDRKDMDSSSLIIEEVPVYPGCKRVKKEEKRTCFQQKMQEHIMKNFRYPKEAQKMGLEGKVSIIFIIDIDGTIANIRTRGPHKILEDEALRIVKKLPKMIPGKYRGIPVRVPFTIPITFRLK